MLAAVGDKKKGFAYREAFFLFHLLRAQNPRFFCGGGYGGF